jgi:chemotaxis protein methyltransferase CheR
LTDELTQVAELVRRESGIALRPEQLPTLRAAIGRVAPGLDPGSLLKAVGDARGRSEVVRKLIDEVTVNETYFLRHQPELDTIDWRAMLAAAQARGPTELRVWSTPCSTGEEPYSLAILALEALGPHAPVSILATDIAESPLRHARAAHYGRRSLRHVPPPLLERHFHDAGGQTTVASHVRELVRFARHNLVSDAFPPLGEEPFDVIVCRNVLIYFDAPTVARTVKALRRSLVPGGQLLLGAADRVTMSAVGARAERPRPAPRRPRVRRRAPASRRPRRPRATLHDALAAADEGRLDAALELTDELLSADALDPGVHFVRGLALRAGGDPKAALASLRRAVYLDPGFARASFELGRAHETLGHGSAARRSYQMALQAMEANGDGSGRLLDPVDAADVAAACHGRLAALGREEARR